MKLGYNFYIFGNPGGDFSAFPLDYTEDFIRRNCQYINSWRAIIYRKERLTYYFLAENLGQGRYFGIGMVLNETISDSPKRLFDFIVRFIENEVIEKGRIIEFDDNANMFYAVDTFSEKEYSTLRRAFTNALENSALVFKRTEGNFAPPNRSDLTIDSSHTDAEIMQFFEDYNLLIVNGNGCEGSTHSALANLQKQVRVKNAEIDQLYLELDELERSKKQYKKINILGVVLIFCCAIVIYFLCSLKDTEKMYYESECEKGLLMDSIYNVGKQLDSISEEFIKLQDNYASQNIRVSEFQHDLSNIAFVITNISMYRQNGHVYFDYYSAKDEEMDLKVVMFTRFEQFIEQQKIKREIKSGNHNFYVEFDKGRFTDGNPRKFVVWCNDKIVGGGICQ